MDRLATESCGYLQMLKVCWFLFTVCSFISSGFPIGNIHGLMWLNGLSNWRVLQLTTPPFAVQKDLRKPALACRIEDSIVNYPSFTRASYLFLWLESACDCCSSMVKVRIVADYTWSRKFSSVIVVSEFFLINRRSYVLLILSKTLIVYRKLFYWNKVVKLSTTFCN